MITNTYNFTDDFMTGYTGIDGPVPFISCCMKIGVANTAIQYFNLYIMWCRISPLNVLIVVKVHLLLLYQMLLLFLL